MTNSIRTGIVLAAVLLAACGKSPENEAVSAPGSAATPAPGASIDTPLKKGEVGAIVTQAGDIVHNAERKILTARFRVENTGTVPLVSQGKLPVRLGIQMVDRDGKPVKVDFIRANLPVIAAGAAAEVDVEIPADAVAGFNLRVLPVQEGVAWFDSFGQDALVIGPLETCPDGTINICGTDPAPTN